MDALDLDHIGDGAFFDKMSEEELTQLDENAAATWPGQHHEAAAAAFLDEESLMHSGFLAGMDLPTSADFALPNAFDMLEDVHDMHFGLMQGVVNSSFETPPQPPSQHLLPPSVLSRATVFPMQHGAASSAASSAAAAHAQANAKKALGTKRKSTDSAMQQQQQRKKTTLAPRPVVTSAAKTTAPGSNTVSVTNSKPLDRIKQTSSFRGVSCCGKDRKWQARIRDANKVRYLGRFSTEVEAALVYDDAARMLKGDRAPTNFVRMEQAVKDQLKQAFLNNNNVIPHNMLHLVVRPKAKQAQQKVVIPKIGTMYGLPDSPMAKVKSTSPAISPSALKSTAYKKSGQAQVQSRLDLNSGFQKQGKAFSGMAHQPGALSF